VSLVIEAQGISFGYEAERPVLRGIRLEVRAGERVAIVGGNGAGKSTLLWCLLGLHRPSGVVRLFGVPPAAARERVGVVFQNPEDQLFMPTILEDVALPLYNRGLPRQAALARAREALAAVGLESEADRAARRLSLGQRKRAAIAAALAMRPELLLMDEPTAELDGRSVRQLGALLEALEVTLVMTGHDVEFLRRAARRAVMLEAGAVIADGPAGQLLSDAGLLERAGLR
jgi:cobalt/nickel transport system ATP-binding protein